MNLSLRRHAQTILLVCAGVLAPVLAGALHAQTMFTSGQNVQPVFEGWQENTDGTFTMVFGYMNRNYEEEPFIAVGANNTFEPGPADRGQPTHFYPRRQQFVFSVTVPADWGKKELVWTLTHAGRTDKAVGSLIQVWHIEEGVWKANRGAGINGRMSKEMPVNHPPVVKVVGGETVKVTLPQTLTLTVQASDDGIPGKRPPRKQTEPPAATDKPMPVAKTGLPSRSGAAGPNTQDKVSARVAFETGLAVTWLHYRGAGSATFEPMAMSIKPTGSDLSGTATTKVTFSEPGTYVLRAVGDDGTLTNGTNITVTVTGSSVSER